MAERDERHRGAGESRYKVEPNIKDGKGGLRDLHTLHWLSKYIYGQGVGRCNGAAGMFKQDGGRHLPPLRRLPLDDPLLPALLNGRPRSGLTFELQPALAEQLSYHSRRALLAVERFMKHYFLVAKDVGDLTTIFVLGARNAAAENVAGPQPPVASAELEGRGASSARVPISASTTIA